MGKKVCAAAKIEAVLPLWNENRLDLVDEFIGEGFRSVVICVNENFLPKEFCGRVFDEQFVKDLPAGVDACGENGEFHTFVYDGPAFHQPVAFKRDQIMRYESPAELGTATYYFQKLSVA